MVFLMLKGRAMVHQKNMSQYGTEQNTMMHPTVQLRMRQTLGYFGASVASTGAMVAALRNSRMAYVHPLILFIGSIGFMFGTMATDYHKSPILKHALLLGFVGSMSLSMVPLINMASMPIIYDALFATGISMGCLGAVAYNAPSEQFL